GYRFGVPRRSAYLEIINTDAEVYGGSGMGNTGRVEVEDVPAHGFPQSIVLTLPPLSPLWLVPALGEDPHPPAPESTGGVMPVLGTPEVVAEREAAAPPEQEQETEEQRIERAIAQESTLVSLPRIKLR